MRVRRSGSTDENEATLTYAWSFGNTRTGTGALPSFTYTSASTFTPTLTVRDEYGLTSTVTMSPITIAEPPGNVAPTAVFTTPTCVGLVCNFSGAASTDPDTGDAVTYLWDFGDGGVTSTSSSPSRTFLAAGTYTVTLTVSDGSGRHRHRDPVGDGGPLTGAAVEPSPVRAMGPLPTMRHLPLCVHERMVKGPGGTQPEGNL